MASSFVSDIWATHGARMPVRCRSDAGLMRGWHRGRDKRDFAVLRGVGLTL